MGGAGEEKKCMKKKKKGKEGARYLENLYVFPSMPRFLNIDGRGRAGRCSRRNPHGPGSSVTMLNP